LLSSLAFPSVHPQSLCYNRPGSQSWPALGAGFKPVGRHLCRWWVRLPLASAISAFCSLPHKCPVRTSALLAYPIVIDVESHRSRRHSPQFKPGTAGTDSRTFQSLMRHRTPSPVAGSTGREKL